MQQLTAEGQRIVDDVARRHGVSTDTVRLLLDALARGNGTQAQFSLQELGGMGQWSLGGMIMVGDMFNNGLKARVDALCTELSNIWRSTTVYSAAMPSQSQSQSQGGFYQNDPASYAGSSLFVQPPPGSSGNWWPAGLGSPSSVGAQNDMRYAVFPQTRRLAVQVNGQVSVYDTGNHQISGVSQQQGGPGQTVVFNSQYGSVRSLDLPLVTGPGSLPPQAAPQPGAPQPYVPDMPAPAEATPAPARNADTPPLPGAPQPDVPDTAFARQSGAGAPGGGGSDDIFAKIERLAELKQKGILSEEEFAAKKAELLSRI